MAVPEAAALLEPVSDDEPCGPDLDLEGDPDFMQAVARIEGILPASFFRRDDEDRLQPFDRTSIAFAAEAKILGALLERTRDLRLLTLKARLAALDRDLPGLAGTLTAIAGLLQSRWSEVHPRGEDGDYGLRSAVLGALDDMPTVVLPLQHLPLAESRRHGSISLRSLMVVEGEVAAPEGADALDRGAIDRALADSDLDDLKAKRAAFASVLEAAAAIYATTVAEGSFAEAVNLERVTAIGRRAVTLLDGVLAARDPSAAPSAVEAAPAGGGDAGGEPRAAPAGGAGSPPGLAVATMADATAALAAVAAYLAEREPSSPAEFLVRQAQSLVGKSFLDVLRTLVPNQADEARIGIGADRIVELSFSQLGSSESGEAPDGGDASGDGADAPAYLVGSRREATDLMSRVAQFYRAAEPSSPIPLLLERAVSTADRDFLTLLKDVLPALWKRDEY